MCILFKSLYKLVYLVVVELYRMSAVSYCKEQFCSKPKFKMLFKIQDCIQLYADSSVQQGGQKGSGNFMLRHSSTIFRPILNSLSFKSFNASAYLFTKVRKWKHCLSVNSLIFFQLRRIPHATAQVERTMKFSLPTLLRHSVFHARPIETLDE